MPVMNTVVAALVFFTFAGSAWADQRNLWQLLVSSREQAQTLSYSGILVSHSGGYSQSSRLFHQKAEGGEFELLEHLDGQSARWVRINQETQCVLPEKKQILSEKHTAATALLPNFSSEKALEDLNDVYTIKAMPLKRVAGREALVVQLQPKDKYRYEYRFYVDKQRHFLLRSETLSDRGVLLEQVGFSEISFDVGALPKVDLLGSESGWQVKSTELRPLSNAEIPYVLPSVLEGFRQINGVCRSKSKDRQLHQFVYSDGLSTVSVFVRKKDEIQNNSTSLLGYGAMMSKSEVQGGHLVTVLGEVPEKTLNLFLKSVQWKTQ